MKSQPLPIGCGYFGFDYSAKEADLLEMNGMRHNFTAITGLEHTQQFTSSATESLLPGIERQDRLGALHIGRAFGVPDNRLNIQGEIILGVIGSAEQAKHPPFGDIAQLGGDDLGGVEYIKPADEITDRRRDGVGAQAISVGLDDGYYFNTGAGSNVVNILPNAGKINFDRHM